MFLKFFGHVTSQHPQVSPKEAPFEGWGLKNFLHPNHCRLEVGELLDLSMNSALFLGTNGGPIGRYRLRAGRARAGQVSAPAFTQCPVAQLATCRSGVVLSRHVSRCEVQPRFARRMLACQHAALCIRALR